MRTARTSKSSLERELLALHLAVDAVDVFRAAVDLGLDAGLEQLRAQRRAELLDVALAVGAPLVEGGGDVLVLLRLQVAEGQVLQFPLQLPDPQAVRQRRVHGARLQGPAAAFGRVERARMPQRNQFLGQPRQHQPGIADHREQHLAQGLGLGRVEAVCRGPVARQSERADAHQRSGDRLPRCPARAAACVRRDACTQGRAPQQCEGQFQGSVSAPMMPAASAARANAGAAACAASGTKGGIESRHGSRAGRPGSFPRQ